RSRAWQGPCRRARRGSRTRAPSTSRYIRPPRSISICRTSFSWVFILSLLASLRGSARSSISIVRHGHAWPRGRRAQARPSRLAIVLVRLGVKARHYIERRLVTAPIVQSITERLQAAADQLGPTAEQGRRIVDTHKNFDEKYEAGGRPTRGDAV